MCPAAAMSSPVTCFPTLNTRSHSSNYARAVKGFRPFQCSYIVINIIHDVLNKDIWCINGNICSLTYCRSSLILLDNRVR